MLISRKNTLACLQLTLFSVSISTPSLLAAEPEWGRTGASYFDCTIQSNAVNPNCNVFRGSDPVANRVVTGVYVASIESYGISEFTLSLEHERVRADIARKEMLRLPSFRGADNPVTAFNRQLVDADQGRWYTRLSTGYTAFGNWTIRYVYVITWEVLPQFKARFEGTPSVIRTGDQVRVFTRTDEGRMVECRRARPGEPWVMYDYSAFDTDDLNGEKMPAYALSDAAAVLTSEGTFIYARGRNGQLLEWSLRSVGNSVRNLSRVTGKADITGKPAVASNREVFVSTSAGRLLTFKPQLPCATSDCWTTDGLRAIVHGDVRTLTAVTGSPSVLEHNNVLHVFVRGTDGRLVQWQRLMSDWLWFVNDRGLASGAQPIQGTPLAIGKPAGVVQVFAASESNRIVQWDGGTALWRAYDLTTAAGWTPKTSAMGVVHNGAVHLFLVHDSKVSVLYKAPETEWKLYDWSGYAQGSLFVKSGIAVDWHAPTSTMRLFGVNLSGDIIEVFKEPNPAPILVRNVTRF